jgi:hypothetical protein
MQREAGSQALSGNQQWVAAEAGQFDYLAQAKWETFDETRATPPLEPTHHPTLCRPALWMPDYTTTVQQTLELCRSYTNNDACTVLRIIGNTCVLKQHLVQPIEETLEHPGWRLVRQSVDGRFNALCEGLSMRRSARQSSSRDSAATHDEREIAPSSFESTSA